MVNGSLGTISDNLMLKKIHSRLPDAKLQVFEDTRSASSCTSDIWPSKVRVFGLGLGTQGPGGGGDRVLHSVMVGLDLLVIVNRCIYIYIM